jgi:hypothetical protein
MICDAAAFWPYQFLKLSLFVGRNAPHSFETKNNKNDTNKPNWEKLEYDYQI